MSLGDTFTIESPGCTYERRALAEQLYIASGLALLFAPALMCFVVIPLQAWMQVYVALAALVFAFVARVWSGYLRRAPTRKASVVVSEDSIATHIDEHVHVYARSHFVRGVIKPEEPIFFSELHTAYGDVLRVAHLDVDTAEAWLTRVGFASDQRTFAFSLSTWTRAATEGVAYAASGLLVAFLVVALVSMLFGSFLNDGEIYSVLFPPLWVGITVWGLWRAIPTTVCVGSDGVSIRRFYGSRFVAYDELESAHHVAGTETSWLLLRLRNARPLRLRATRPYTEAVVTLAFAISQAQRRARARRAFDDARLDRNGRPLDAWREAVRSSLGGSVFREAHAGRDAMLNVAEDPSARPTQRVAAALALASADVDARTRVRVALDGCANEPLRNAMRAALDDTLDEAAVVRLEAIERRSMKAPLRS